MFGQTVHNHIRQLIQEQGLHCLLFCLPFFKHYNCIVSFLFLSFRVTSANVKECPREVRWPSGSASDSGARGQGFDPHSGRRVVSLSKIHLPPKKYW